MENYKVFLKGNTDQSVSLDNYTLPISSNNKRENSRCVEYAVSFRNRRSAWIN
jgi:hypothetical protein